MLLELRIRNFAVIDRLTVRLGSGLNVLTGETGAGKSILVGALSLLLGGRASADMVRAGANRALLEASFDLDHAPQVLVRLEDHGIEPEDGLLILRREIAAEGRSRAWLNGSPTTVGLLAEIGEHLVDLHGQHEHQTLLRTAEQLTILDAYADAGALVAEVEIAADHLGQLESRLADLDRRRADVASRKVLLATQAEEIESAGLELDEEERLDTEAHRLEHAEELSRLAAGLHHALYAAEDSLLSRLREARRMLDRLNGIDPSHDESASMLEQAYFQIEETGRAIGNYGSRVEHDPRRLEEIRHRQALFFRLKSKYGPELAEVIETGRRAREELDLLDTAELDRRVLERELAEARVALTEAAAALTSRRSDSAARLEREIDAMLPDLGLAEASFRVLLRQRDEIHRRGAESVEFLVSLNRGFEPRSLARVASGGELSRVMLAIKTILARLDRIPTLVFDEVDAGIGGMVGHQIGERLHRIAEHHQVLVITHLAQIACRAGHHLYVEKQDSDGLSTAGVKVLDQEARVAELARMLGGDAGSVAGLEHARELLGARSRR